ncbi:MAG: NAD-dependent epimerase/dehydratase family protein [Deltaproteobacteria bacterium]|nr:NAD-dependent epimerase/dehydratase family protein [Deltaproteobacteria bacterium]
MAIEGKNIFVTGGAGFIGSKFVERVIEKNRVVVYDSFARNSIESGPAWNHPNLRIVKGDILDFARLKEAMRGTQIVIHLAAVAGIDTVIRSITNTMKVNLIGTYHVLESAVALGGIERLVDFSTSEVFGSYAYKSEEGDTTALGSVGEGRWTYAVSKLAAEHLGHAYCSEQGLPLVSIRPFNVYGPGQVGEGAIHIFVRRALANEPIEIHGDGDQIRSWCYVDDLVDGLMACVTNEKAVGNVFNIGNPRGTITIFGLAETVLRVTGSRSELRFVPKNYADVELRIPSIEKAKTILGFCPQVDLEEGIRRTAEWYRAGA